MENDVSNLDVPRSVDSFIAYFDVLGWKSLVSATERENDFSVQKVIDVLDMIKSELGGCRDFYENEGPEICTGAWFENGDFNFQYTVFSDSVVLSSEVSPAAFINLLNCCRAVYFKLFMRQGLMCRGYIKRGLLYHTTDYCVGSGLADVVEGEKDVSIFKTEDGEHGTPFIEVDRNIVQYVDDEISDDCVKGMFSRIVKSEGDVAAIFPFRNLDPGIFWNGSMRSDEQRQTIVAVRAWIGNAKEMMGRHVDPCDERARQKERCLLNILDAQCDVCKQMEKEIEEMTEQFPADRFTPKSFPGLFQ